MLSRHIPNQVSATHPIHTLQHFATQYVHIFPTQQPVHTFPTLWQPAVSRPFQDRLSRLRLPFSSTPAHSLETPSNCSEGDDEGKVWDLGKMGEEWDPHPQAEAHEQ